MTFISKYITRGDDAFAIEAPTVASGTICLRNSGLINSCLPLNKFYSLIFMKWSFIPDFLNVLKWNFLHMKLQIKLT